MRLTMKLFISSLVLTLSLGLAVLAAPVDVDVDPVPSAHQEFDRSPNSDWALERRSNIRILVEMQTPTPKKLSETEATQADLDKIVKNVEQLLRLAHNELDVSATVNVEVDTTKLTHIPNSGVELLFTAKVPGLKNVCKGICTGAVTSDSSSGWIKNSKGKKLH